MTSEAIRYLVRLPRPEQHRVELEVWFPPAGETLTLSLPVWTPGSYLVREYARHLHGFSAETPDGRLLELRRIDKRSWRIEGAAGGVRVRYTAHANELTVRTNHVDGSHALLNGGATFLYDEARRAHAHRVRVEAPAGWRVFTALEEDGGEWVAEDYDALVDAPLEVGPHDPVEFVAGGVPHRVVLWGEPQPDRARLVADLQKVVETEAAMLGGLPLRRYLFLLYLVEKGRGGLEHRASTALLYPRNNLASQRGWEDFLNLAAHEYFHLWNVKRIKPRAFVPYDYGQENYTRLLWWFEGGTSYYDMLLVRRAGLTAPSRYLTRLGETVTALHGTPGRKVLPLEEASLLSWIKHYRPDESSPNTAISYYLKGELVCWLLDLELRRATADRRSLDDLVRLLWERYGDGRGVPEDGVEAAAGELAGIDLRPFFDRALRSTGELDYSALEHIGLELLFRSRESPGDKGGTPPRQKDAPPKGWLGAGVRGSGTVGVVYDGSPAHEAGLSPEDELVALDGFKVDGGSFVSRCEDRGPGQTVRLTLFRRDRLMELDVVLGARPEDAAWLQKVAHPTDAQRSAFEAWCGASWDDPA